MNTREEFIEEFYNQFGSYPDEETILVNTGENYYQRSQPGFRQQSTRSYHNDGVNQFWQKYKRSRQASQVTPALPSVIAMQSWKADHI